MNNAQENTAGNQISSAEQQSADDAAKWLQSRSQTGQMCDQIAERRAAAVEASVGECLVRAGGAAMCVIARSHALLIGLRNHGLDESAMTERAQHLPERMHGARLAIETIVDELCLAAVVEKNGGEFDREQLEFDVRQKLVQFLRELV